VRSLLNSDASALLRYEGGQFIPLAIDGLMQDVLGRRFALKDHPRLEAIARAGDVVRFPPTAPCPTPMTACRRITTTSRCTPASACRSSRIRR
jgi:anaerobic nitric oxide reductase transcription regulator